MMRQLFEPLAWIADLAMPRVCHVCGAQLMGGDRFICDVCMAGIPRIAPTTFQPYTTAEQRGGNALDSLCVCPQVEMAMAWMYYDKTSTSASLLHDFKYRGFSRLARFLGYTMSAELEHTGIFNGVDCMVPIPLHSSKLLRRGYNQARMLALGIKDRTGLPIAKALKAHRHHTQTLLNSAQRLANVKDVFYTDSSCGLVNLRSPLTPRVLLIDDVCTTGSTLYNAAEALRKAYPGIRIHILTFALTENG